MTPSGLVVVVSAPSGGGKGTILQKVLEADPKLAHSVSATTRAPRATEVDGVHYTFLDEPTFRRWIDEGRFAEWARVHGQYYGTPKAQLERLLAQGRDVVLELDVAGMRSVRGLYSDAVTVFIMPPSLAELEKRLHARGGLTDAEIGLRLENAKQEIAAKGEYDHVIVNDSLDSAVSQFREIIRRARAAQNGNS